MRFAIDLDSTLLSLPVVERACADTGTVPGLKMSDTRDWCFSTFPAPLRQRIYELFEDPEFMCTLQPNPGAQYFIKTLLNHHHSLFIVTARAQAMHDRTQVQISKLFPNTTPVILLPTAPKMGTYLKLKPDVVIDDSPANVAGAVMAGIRLVILYSDESTPYNHRIWGGFNVADMTELMEIAEDDTWNEMED
jgi:5'(3')-deoxyribonucleotidase